MPVPADSLAVNTDLRPVRLEVEHAYCPLGIGLEAPRLAWLLHAKVSGQRQTGYHIRVGSSPTLLAAGRADVWDSGVVGLGRHVGIRYGGPPLSPTTRYFWHVRVADAQQRWSDWSEAGWFETALAPGGWCGDWIGAPTWEQSDPAPEPLLRHNFRLAELPVTRARLYAAGVGYVELSLNGARVGDEVLEPGFTRFDKRVQYVTRDVTDLLCLGDNTIGARLGRGFFGMDQTNVWQWHNPPWNGEPRLLAQLVVDFADSSSQSVATGSDWWCTDGPVRYDCLYGGETFDARHDRPGWDTADYDASSWKPAAVLAPPAGELVPQVHEPIRVMQTLRPTALTTPAPGVYVFHLPVCLAGWVRIRLRGPRGTTVRLLYGETLDGDGRVHAVNEWVPDRFQLDEYILAGDAAGEIWEPRYTYKGFQYVEVTGWPGQPSLDDLDGRAVHSDIAKVGHFECSNELFNQVRTMTCQTIVNNWHGIPTDTPMYEKNGWTGDAQLMAQTFLFEFDLRRLLPKWMGDHADSQGTDGLIPGIVPDSGWGMGWPGQAPPWHASYPMICWQLFWHHGDRDVLTEHYPNLRAYLDGWLARSATGIYPSTLGDYLPPGYPENGPEDLRLAGTAYTYANAVTVADIAQELGDAANAVRYRATAAHIRAAFNAEFLRGDAYVTGSDSGYRQTPALLGLALGLVPDEAQAAVLGRLVADIEERDGHLNTGALGTKFLLTELTRRGQGELAYRIATRRTYPGWGYWAANGATTLWERWDTGARSRNHVFLGGAIVEWFYTCLAGIRALSPGYDRIEIAPQPLGDLSFVDAATDTPHGRVAVRWQRDSSGFTVDVDIPVGATAVIVVPAVGDAAVVQTGGAEASTPVKRLADGSGTGVSFEVNPGHYRFHVPALGV